MHETSHFYLDLLDTQREPLTGLIGDYHSKLFSTQMAVNPLVAAAMPLLTFAGQIQHTVHIQDLTTLSASLIHEMRAFENKAYAEGYRSQLILAARYLLCTLLDEFIASPHPEPTLEHSLLQTFQHESWGGERFFIILERSCEDPKLYIDLLELGYLCLSFGFQGKYATKTQTKSLGVFIDQLYHIIEQQRGETSQRLLQEPQKLILKKSWALLPPWWITLLASACILGLIFIPYYHKLSQTMEPLKTKIQQIEKQPNE